MAIQNDRELEITRQAAERFRGAIRVHENAPLDPGLGPRLFKAVMDSMKSELEVLDGQIADYLKARAVD